MRETSWRALIYLINITDYVIFITVLLLLKINGNFIQSNIIEITPSSLTDFDGKVFIFLGSCNCFSYSIWIIFRIKYFPKQGKRKFEQKAAGIRQDWWKYPQFCVKIGNNRRKVPISLQNFKNTNFFNTKIIENL